MAAKSSGSVALAPKSKIACRAWRASCCEAGEQAGQG